MKRQQAFNYQILVILIFVGINFSLADTDPIFHDKNNIQQFLKGYLEGLKLEVNELELSSITDQQFALDEFQLGLDYQGLSILIKEKEKEGLEHICDALIKLEEQLPKKSRSLLKLVQISLEVFGNYSKYVAAKEKYEQIYPDRDVSSFLWDALDFISLNNNFHLSGQMVAKIILELHPLLF
ncbi:transmembrane protein, putative (macronuclear) [Tetrahymena thermophila SB210]|uniref:Transmembrane protein, putative n=1 Tax=Tetrahymena thermophila (strain SB210) TaxID=312017 RepID=I7M399_TETTS|nr:transmembrane protein, putative [Tetrahymena thermophila SB210]EAS02740.1 transmembrane protein, putative [Tetrahymena thermophila SB210]|eukprot:XP_001022985.1 transmembrane protein, putative [Tetrahymena thermophila SB210]